MMKLLHYQLFLITDKRKVSHLVQILVRFSIQECHNLTFFHIERFLLENQRRVV